MTPPSPPAVVFDIDDTLVDFAGATRVAVAAWVAELGAQHVAGRAAAAWQVAERAHYPAYARGEIGFAEQRRRRARDFCAALGLPRPADPDAWYAGYLACFEPALALFGDVLAALDDLDRRGVPIAALSNSSAAHQDRKLRRFGIRDRFQSMVCCDDVGAGKPAPAAFEAVCARLSLPPARVVYIGDDLDNDARAATAAGLHGVWLDRAASGHPAPGVPVLHHLGHITDVLDPPP